MISYFPLELYFGLFFKVVLYRVDQRWQWNNRSIDPPFPRLYWYMFYNPWFRLCIKMRIVWVKTKFTAESPPEIPKPWLNTILFGYALLQYIVFCHHAIILHVVIFSVLARTWAIRVLLRPLQKSLYIKDFFIFPRGKYPNRTPTALFCHLCYTVLYRKVSLLFRLISALLYLPLGNHS